MYAGATGSIVGYIKSSTKTFLNIILTLPEHRTEPRPDNMQGKFGEVPEIFSRTERPTGTLIYHYMHWGRGNNDQKLEA